MNMVDSNIKFQNPNLKSCFSQNGVFTETKSLSKDFEVTEHHNELKFGTHVVEYIIQVCTEEFCNSANILLMGGSQKLPLTSINVFFIFSLLIWMHIKASVKT